MIWKITKQNDGDYDEIEAEEKKTSSRNKDDNARESCPLLSLLCKRFPLVRFFFSFYFRFFLIESNDNDAAVNRIVVRYSFIDRTVETRALALVLVNNSNSFFCDNFFFVVCFVISCLSAVVVALSSKNLIIERNEQKATNV